MLRKFYEITRGHAGHYNINLWEVGKDLGLDRDTTAATYDYLRGEGLLKSMTIGGGATITHEGVKEVENAEENPQEPTMHFPAFIVNITDKSLAIHDDHIEVRGDVIGSALGRGAESKTRDIAVYRGLVDQSSFDPEVKRILVEARETLEHLTLTQDDKNDAKDDLNKLVHELGSKSLNPTRVQRFWNRIKEIAPVVATLLESVVSIKKILQNEN